MDQEPQSPAVSDDVPRHLIIRPRMRLVGFQLAVGFALSCCIAALLWVFGLLTGLVAGALGIGFIALALAHLIWFRRNAPRAIVATEQFLAITHQGGEQLRIPWSSISSANHSGTQLGMQWEFNLMPGEPTILMPAEPVILRDVGIDSGRWGILRAVIIELAGAHGASVMVDPLSERIYGQQG